MSGIAVVTGGSRGIGASCVRKLAARGYDVAFSYLTNADLSESLADEIRAGGRRALALQVDLASEDDILRLFATVDAELGALNVLVNNTGITGGFAPISEVAGDTVRRVIATNVTGTILCCREAVNRMSMENGGAGGVIVNLSSCAAFTGSPGEYVYYAASKGAVNSLTVGLAREVAGAGIRVNAVAPGTTATDIHADGGRPDRPAQIAATMAIGRIATPDEVAEAVVWLTSDAASYVSGAVLPVMGGG
jgi:NAD(P)-dependent dehydrogenase (short-subunit alcohol dehydrogenase family)